MFLEEKIDILKKHFPQTDFRDPFTDWPEILKKIESKFIIKNNSDYHFANWFDNIKNKTLICAISRTIISQEIKKLDPKSNYWIVIVRNNNPTEKLIVFDCKLNSLEILISIIPNDFYIIDKKYNWLTYFKVDEGNDTISIFKSGPGHTHFDV